jgi:hypothetical protein
MLKILLLIIAGALGVAIFIFLFSYLFTFVLVMLGFFSFCWVIGVPITVKAGGKKIGYIRWTRFHSTQS